MTDKCIECEKDTVLKDSDLRIEYNKLKNYCKLLEQCLDVKEELNKCLREENEKLENELINYEVNNDN